MHLITVVSFHPDISLSPVYMGYRQQVFDSQTSHWEKMVCIKTFHIHFESMLAGIQATTEVETEKTLNNNDNFIPY